VVWAGVDRLAGCVGGGVVWIGVVRLAGCVGGGVVWVGVDRLAGGVVEGGQVPAAVVLLSVVTCVDEIADVLTEVAVEGAKEGAVLVSAATVPVAGTAALTAAWVEDAETKPVQQER
jgi:hypothetical protein